jgi:hypothetical protein
MTGGGENLEPHPLAEVYAEAERVYRLAQTRLAELRAQLRRVEAELEGLTGELAGEYGPGYLTVKAVRNRQGRRYRYPVWRRPGSSDIYLTGDPRAERILELRGLERGLKREIARLKRALRLAWAYMESTREYRGTCIDERTGEYTPCPARAPGRG